MHAPQLHWMRGRTRKGLEGAPAVEWIGCDDAGQAVARVVRIGDPASAIGLGGNATWDAEARVVELRPAPPEGIDWLVYVGGRVVGRAALPLQAVRTAEDALR